MLNTIALKTFLTSAVKVLTWLLATTTKICTNVWSRKDYSLSPSHQLITIKYITPTYMNERCFCSFSSLYVYTLSAPLIFKAIAFVRWVVTHSLADSNFHGHCPDVIIQQHFLWYLIMSVQSGTFKTAFGSSRITYSAYQKRSTKRKTYCNYQECYYAFILDFTPI